MEMKAHRIKRSPLALLAFLTFVITVSSPKPGLAQITPINIGHANNGGAASGVVVSGNYLYLANGNDGLRIYDARTRPIQ